MIDLIQHIIPHSWIIIGLILILVETFIIPGIGFLFAGIAAFITGSLIIFDFIDNNFYSQLACFLSLSVVIATLAWLPMKKLNKNSQQIKNLVNETAIVCDDKIKHNMLGKVKWTGTIFNAKLSSEAQEKLKDQEVTIVEIKGNILIIQ